MATFKYSDKKIIDFAIPSLVAAGVGFYFIRKGDRDTKFLVFVIILAFLLLYAVTSATTKVIREKMNKPQKINTPEDSVKIVKDDQTGQTKVVSTNGIDISGLCQRVFDDIEDTPFLGHDEAVWWDVTQLSDTDLANLFNYWTDNFFKENSESLVQAIEGETFDATGLYDNRAYIHKQTVLARLKKLGAK